MMTAALRERFESDGFLHLEGVLDEARYLDPLIEQYEVHLDALVSRLSSGQEAVIRSRPSGFIERAGELYRQTDRRTFENHFNISVPLSGVTESFTFFNGSALFDLIRSKPILDVVEGIMGGEISSSPIQHARLKPPARYIDVSMKSSGLLAETPWHQDASVVPPTAETEMLTVWIPLVDVTRETGCLRFVKGGHKGGLRDHAIGKVDGTKIKSLDTQREHVVETPACRGDMILIHRHCPHSSLPNLSTSVRMSVDLRYHPSHQSSGREALPGFVVRSRMNPDSVLTDARAWQQRWADARRKLIGRNVTDSYAWIESAASD